MIDLTAWPGSYDTIIRRVPKISATISKNIPKVIPENIIPVNEAISEESVMDLLAQFYKNNIVIDKTSIKNLENEIYLLKHRDSDLTISSKRVETIYDIVKMGTTLKTNQVKHTLGLKQNHQAISVMKKTARIHSANVDIEQERKGNKIYKLFLKKGVRKARKTPK